MTLDPALTVAIVVAVLAVVVFAIHRAFPALTLKGAVADAKAEVGKAETALSAVQSRLDAYTHAELVKLAGAIMDHLADTSAAEQQIKAGQATMASQAQLLAAVKARVAAATISAAV